MKKVFLEGLLITVLVFVMANVVFAEDNIISTDLYDFSEIEEVIDGTEYSINFEDTMKQLASGESEGIFLDLFKSFFGELLGELIYNKEVVVKVILMAISLALINNLSSVFKNGQISETGFFAIYCMIVTVLISGFMAISQMIGEVLEVLIGFMNALIPSLMLAMSFMGAYTSKGGFCQLILMGIMVVEKIILTFILPIINVYVVLMLVNSMVNEDYISKCASIIDSFVKWFVKTMLAVFTGMNLIQSMMLPSIDGTKIKGIQKLAGMVGGNVAYDVVLVTSNVIKNAIGTASLIFVVIIVAVPVIKVWAFSAMYRFTAAIIQPVSDKRVITAVESVSKGAVLLSRIVIFCGVLFGITIAIMCIATNNMG